MVFRIFLLVLAILPCYSQASWWNNITNYLGTGNRTAPPNIRILVVHDVNNVNLEVRGKYSLFDPYTNSYISSRFIGKNRQIEARSDGLKWGEAFPGLYQIRIRPDEFSTVTIIDGIEYEGDIYIYDIGGTISIVNQVPIENYIHSLLADYQQQPLENETLAALAITARTNAYYQAVNPKNTYWAVDAKKVNFQGHVSIDCTIAEAIHLTRYMIMSRSNSYEEVAIPFAAQFVNQNSELQNGEQARISLEEANKLSQSGEHAAQILSKAFPGSSIMVISYKER